MPVPTRGQRSPRRGLPAELALVLERGAPTPLAVQLADALRAAAGRGELAVGDRVPASRVLAADLGVSRTVTAAAYDQLVAEGWLAPRRGSGTYVAAAPAMPADPPPCAPGLADLPHGAPGLTDPPSGAPGLADPPSGLADRPCGSTGFADLRPGSPCLAVLDRAAWRRAWRRAGGREPATRPEPAGARAYRSAVATLLLHHRGLPAQPDAVLATAGTTAGFAELVTVLAAHRGRPPRVAVEDPGYGRAVAVLRAAGADVVGVEVDADGLRVDAIPAAVDAVYCTPAHHFPLGARLSVTRRGALVARARDEGFLVVEDDYDGELRYDVSPLPLLAALAPDVVVHLGTVSKVLTPTLGVGWMVAPPGVHDAVLAHRRATSLRPSPAGQAVIAALHADGALARHLARLRRELAARRTAVVAAVEATGHTVRGDRAGAHLVVPLSGVAVEVATVDAAAASGLLLSGLAGHHLAPATHGVAQVPEVLVGWAAPSRADLDEALRRLTTVLRTMPPP